MKAIMISVKPKWVAKILNGEKTLEFRKTMPRCAFPIDVYIYVTKDKKEKLFRNLSNKHYFLLHVDTDGFNGQVVAKFTLNNVEKVRPYPYINDRQQKASCLSIHDYVKYLKGKNGYAWCVENLKVFDEPKDIKSFLVYSHTVEGVGVNGEPKAFKVLRPLEKAHQSWGYIEV